MKQDFQIGNSFDSQTLTAGHARKVWRRIDEQLPGGYRIVNMADFASAGLVRSGMAVAKSTASGADERDITVIPWASIASAESVDSLNIIGFLQEDTPVYTHGSGASATYNYGTGNIVVKGEIYGYMLGDTQAQATSVAAKIKGMTQKNGLSIRVIEG